MKAKTGIFLTGMLSWVVFAGPALAHDGTEVTIYRGAQAETVHLNESTGVAVMRGQPVSELPAQTARYTHKPVAHMDAGNTLWIVDSESDRLFACELRNTTQVGGRKIRCRSRRLPAALR